MTVRDEHGVHRQMTEAMSEGWVGGGSFLGSVLSGTLVGWLVDNWLGTAPWFVVGGIILGSYTGFMRVWQYSRRMLPDDERGDT